MLKCNECGKVISNSELKEYYEDRGECCGEPVSELCTNTTCDCGGEFEDAIFCHECNEWKLESEMANSYICKDCAKRKMTFNSALKYGEEEKPKIDINDFVFYLLGEDESQVELVLLEYLSKNYSKEELQVKVNDYCSYEIDNYASFLEKEKAHV